MNDKYSITISSNPIVQQQDSKLTFSKFLESMEYALMWNSLSVLNSYKKYLYSIVFTIAFTY